MPGVFDDEANYDIGNVSSFSLASCSGPELIYAIIEKPASFNQFKKFSNCIDFIRLKSILVIRFGVVSKTSL